MGESRCDSRVFYLERSDGGRKPFVYPGITVRDQHDHQGRIEEAVIFYDVTGPADRDKVAALLAEYPDRTVILIVEKCLMNVKMISFLAMDIGGFVYRESLHAYMNEILELLNHGECPIEPDFQVEVSEQILFSKDRVHQGASLRIDLDVASAVLSPMDQRMLQGIADGLGTKDIAKRYSYAVPTVYKGISDLIQTLGAKDRTGAIVAGIREGLLVFDEEDP